MAFIYTEPKVSKFRLNQVGFMNKASKKFVYTGKDAKTFTVKKMLDGALTDAFSGELKYMAEDELFPESYVGDFSDLTEDGVYFIECGEETSRIFSISESIYEPVLRILTTYFVWQRCGDNAGWNGKCHQGEKLIDKNGRLHEFTGGHHQSCDLRKWKFGCPKGVKALSDFLMLKNSKWNKGEVEYDIAHSVKYYLSLISDEGYVFDCSFVPFDYDREKCEGKGFGDYSAFWKPFKYFDRPTSQTGHYNVISLLASAAISLKNYDSDLAEKCEEGAKKIWEYMLLEGENTEKFEWEVYPPIGHFGFKEDLFDYFYKNSAWTLCAKALAGLDMYKMSGDEDVKNSVISALSKLYSYMRLEEDGSLKYFMLDETNTKIAEMVNFFPYNIPLAFVEALEVLGDHSDKDKWLEVVKAAVEKYEKMAKGNCYGKTTNRYIKSNGKFEHSYFAPSFNDDHAETASFLVKASKYVEKEKCLEIAQSLLDWLLGFNPFDSSNIEGVGFNNIKQATFGEMIPAIPQIPGGVCTDLTPDAFGKIFGSEYDMPIVGHTLIAFANLLEALKK